MRRSLWYILLSVLGFGLLVAGLFYYWHRTSPRYALDQMVNALVVRNYDTFYHYLDVKSILSHLAQEAGQDLLPFGAEPGDELSRLGQSLGRKFTQHLLPKMFESYEKELRKGMAHYLGTLTASDLLALKAAVAMADITQKGDEALVILRFPKDAGSLRLTMSRDSKDDAWRVVSVNYQDVKRIIGKELR